MKIFMTRSYGTLNGISMISCVDTSNLMVYNEKCINTKERNLSNMKRRHYKLYRVRVSFIYVSHPHLTGGPFSMNAIIGVAGNVNLNEDQLNYHFTQIMDELLHSEPSLEEYSDFKDLQVYNEGILEAVPTGTGEEGESHYLPFHVGLTITTDDCIVIM